MPDATPVNQPIDQAAEPACDDRELAGHPENWPPEVGGPKGPEPTRYGDWERKGRVSDF